MQEQPFYIGQKVVALENLNSIVKDKIYTITGVSECCGIWYVTVNVRTSSDTCHFSCNNCGGHVKPISGNKYRGGKAKAFAPVHEGFESISFTKVLEEELVSVN